MGVGIKFGEIENFKKITNQRAPPMISNFLKVFDYSLIESMHIFIRVCNLYMYKHFNLPSRSMFLTLKGTPINLQKEC